MDWRAVINQLHDDSKRLALRGAESVRNGASSNGIADLAVAETLLCLANAIMHGLKDE